ncbi:MAG: hypothetical protein Q7R96_04125 [Nanoarchaeota archaeon]|nr:hypothetical protein [Nanoarchaeota archaeon]
MKPLLTGLILAASALALRDVPSAKEITWAQSTIKPISVQTLSEQSKLYRQAQERVATLSAVPETMDTLFEDHERWIKQGTPYANFDAYLLAITAHAQAPRIILHFFNTQDFRKIPGFLDMEQRIDKEFLTLDTTSQELTPQQMIEKKAEIIKYACFTYTRSKLRSSQEGIAVGPDWETKIINRLDTSEGNCVINSSFFYTAALKEFKRKGLVSIIDTLHIELGIAQEGNPYLHVWVYDTSNNNIIELNDPHNDILHGCNLNQQPLMITRGNVKSGAYRPIIGIVGKTNSGVTDLEFYIRSLPLDIHQELLQNSK